MRVGKNVGLPRFRSPQMLKYGTFTHALPAVLASGSVVVERISPLRPPASVPPTMVSWRAEPLVVDELAITPVVRANA